MRQIRLILTAFLVLGPIAANATPIQSSTSVHLTFRDCLSGGTACDGITGTVEGTFDGDPGDLTAAASQTNAAYGTSSASAALSGVAGAPILSAHVTSLGGTVADPGTRNGANTAALQRYTYTGAAATTRTFGGTVSYNQSIPAENAGFPNPIATGSGVFVHLEIFTLADAFLDAGVTAQDNFFTLFNDYMFAPGYTSLASADFADSLSNAAVVGLPSLTVNLNPGDTIWALTILQGIAANGAEVNVDSLVTGWDDIDGLAPANSVPEPGTLTLIVIGLFGMGLARRKKV